MINLLKKLSRHVPEVTGVTILSLSLCRVFYFNFLSYKNLIGVIPDDAFYYIQMASHRANDGFWSFDGTNPATGFHLLYGYLLFFITLIFGAIKWKIFSITIGIFASIFMGLSAYFTSRAAQLSFDSKAALIAIIPYLAPITLMQSTSLMESWLVLLFSSLTIYLITTTSTVIKSNYIALFLVGLLGSLSRSDYGLLPGIIFCVVALSAGINSMITKRSFMLLAGAVTGVVIVLLHDFVATGHFTQASAQTKLYWSQIDGNSIAPAISMLVSIMFPFNFIKLGNKLIIIMTVIGIFYSVISAYNFNKIKLRPFQNFGIAAGCIITVIGYTLFYRYNSGGLQPWYSANFTAPVAITMASILFYAFKSKALPVALILLPIYLLYSLSELFIVPWPHQSGMMQAGLYIKHSNISTPIAAWNAGIISYFSEKNIINIDGLANDDILPYVKKDSLLDYLKMNNINYIADYSAMISNENIRIRGGYTNLDRHAIPVAVIDGKNPAWNNTQLTLYRIN